MLMVSVGVGGARVRFYTDVSVVSIGGDRAMCGRWYSWTMSVMFTDVLSSFFYETSICIDRHYASRMS